MSVQHKSVAPSGDQRLVAIQSLAAIDAGFQLSLIGEASNLLAQDPRASVRLFARRLCDEETKLRLTQRLIDGLCDEDGKPRHGLAPAGVQDLHAARQRHEDLLRGVKDLWERLLVLETQLSSPASQLPNGG